MKHFVVAIAALAALTASTAGWSKGDITSITVERVGSNDVVAISEPDVLDRFVIWSGPGVVGWDMAKTIPAPDDAAFIVDWTQGALTSAPDAPTYKVTMYVDRYEPPCNKYEVLYRVDGADTGYVYLPRWDEEIGRCNMSLIARDVEGNWFRSSKAWDDVAERFGVRTSAGVGDVLKTLFGVFGDWAPASWCDSGKVSWQTPPRRARATREYADAHIAEHNPALVDFFCVNGPLGALRAT